MTESQRTASVRDLKAMGILRVWAEMGVWLRRGTIASAFLFAGAAMNGVSIASKYVYLREGSPSVVKAMRVTESL